MVWISTNATIVDVHNTLISLWMHAADETYKMNDECEGGGKMSEKWVSMMHDECKRRNEWNDKCETGTTMNAMLS